MSRRRPSVAPSIPRVRFSRPANLGLFADLQARLPELEASLPSITVPVGVLIGGLSPMPPSAGTESAARIPVAWSQLVPGAGHFPWYEAPGCIVTAMDRLVGGTCPSAGYDALAGLDRPNGGGELPVSPKAHDMPVAVLPVSGSARVAAGGTPEAFNLRTCGDAQPARRATRVCARQPSTRS